MSNKNKQETSSGVVLKTVEVVHEKGSQVYEQGIKGGRFGSEFKNGSMRHYNGHGGASVISPSNISLIVSSKDGFDVPISIKEELRNIGIEKITKKRLEVIQKTMPEEIRLEQKDGKMKISEQEKAWFDEIKKNI